MNLILAILLSLTGLVSPVSGQAVEPVIESRVEQVASTPIPATLGLEWLPYTLSLTPVSAPDNLIIILSSGPENCGAKLSPTGLGGCTTWLKSGTILISISPELAWTEAGNHVLYHELGHAILDTNDECTAEAFAHQHTSTTLWSYPECATASATNNA